MMKLPEEALDVKEVIATLAVLCQRMDDVEARHTELKRVLNGNLEKIGLRLDDLNIAVGQYRLEQHRTEGKKPSWAVALSFSALLSLCTALIVLLVRQ